MAQETILRSNPQPNTNTMNNTNLTECDAKTFLSNPS